MFGIDESVYNGHLLLAFVSVSKAKEQYDNIPETNETVDLASSPSSSIVASNPDDSTSADSGEVSSNSSPSSNPNPLILELVTLSANKIKYLVLVNTDTGRFVFITPISNYSLKCVTGHMINYFETISSPTGLLCSDKYHNTPAFNSLALIFSIQLMGPSSYADSYATKAKAVLMHIGYHTMEQQQRVLALLNK